MQKAPRFLLVAFSMTSVLWPVIAQQPKTSPSPQPPGTPQQQATPEVDSQDVVRITTSLVQIDAVVTRDGKQVTDLNAEDFEIFEDGRPQVITNFSYISNTPDVPLNAGNPPTSRTSDKTAPPLPPAVARPNDVRRTIALVVDDLGMSFESISRARSQARKFVDEQLQPHDLVAIVHTSGDVGALQQFTTDRRLLHNAIDRLRWYACSRAGLHVFAPLGSQRVSVDAPCGGARNLRGTLRAVKFIVEGMRELPGRKSLVLMSDYLPVETQEPGTTNLTPGDGDLADDRVDYTAQLKKVAELAIRGSVVIYAVDTRGLAYTGITAMDDFKGLSPVVTARDLTNRVNSTLSARSMSMVVGREGSALIAKETGGFFVRNSNDFELKRIAEDQKGYYLLGYRPTGETFNRKFHHIKVTVKRRGLDVRSRNGFFGVSQESAKPAALSSSDRLKKALMSPFGANDITVRLTTMFTNFENGSLLRGLLYIKAQDLVFVEAPDGAHKANFDLGIILFGENGQIADYQSRLVTLTLRDELYQSAVRDGVVYSFEVPLKQAGAFQFRVALLDQASSHVGSAGQFIEIPSLGNGRLALSGLVLLKDMSDQPDGANVEPQNKESAINAGPAVRQFRPGDKLIFAYSIYNAPQEPSSHSTRLTAQTRLFRDGKAVSSGEAIPVNVMPQADLKRIPNIGRLQLGKDLSPGEYVLQVIVTDRLAKDKQQVASQWIDFEIK